MGPLKNLTRPDLDLLAAACRRARETGWHVGGDRGWLNADETINVGWDESSIRIWRTDARTEMWPAQSTDYEVATVRQGVDVLAALGILPADLSSQHAAGMQAERWDCDGIRWSLHWVSDTDVPGATLEEVDAEHGPLSTTPPTGQAAPVDEQPGPVCVTPAPCLVDATGDLLVCGTTAVGTIKDGRGKDSPVCQAHAELAIEAGLTVTPLAHPAARTIVARLTPAERIAAVAEIAPEYVRPVEATR